MTQPAWTVNLGLGTASGSALVQPSAAEYAQQPVTFTTFAGFLSAMDQAANFGTVVTSWGTLTSWAIFDNAGNQMCPAKPLTTPIGGAVGLNVTVMAGGIAVTLA
jgi:hypothetical protein